MKIKRTVNGIQYEFELSATELWTAYEEEQHNFDTQDILDLIEGLDSDEVRSVYGIGKREFRKRASEFAYEMRRMMDKYECSWEYARDEAVRGCLRRKGDANE